MLVEDSQQLGFQANSRNPRRLWQSTISYTWETSWRPRCGSQPLGKVPDRRRRDRLFPMVVIHISVSRKFPSGDHEGAAGFHRGQHHNDSGLRSFLVRAPQRIRTVEFPQCISSGADVSMSLHIIDSLRSEEGQGDKYYIFIRR